MEGGNGGRTIGGLGAGKEIPPEVTGGEGAGPADEGGMGGGAGGGAEGYARDEAGEERVEG